MILDQNVRKKHNPSNVVKTSRSLLQFQIILLKLTEFLNSIENPMIPLQEKTFSFNIFTISLAAILKSKRTTKIQKGEIRA